MTQPQWDPDHYQKHAGYVPELGQSILERLAPMSGERILDLGCGDGALTVKLIEASADVVAVDASPDMVAAARRRGIDARVMNGETLEFTKEFDAVFSNAALHWMRDAAAVLRGVFRALRPGGRFVAEAGGHGNVAAIHTALRAVLIGRGLKPPMTPWSFPTANAYERLLTEVGFEVTRTELVPRPTPLPTGMDGWLDTFGAAFLEAAPKSDRTAVRNEAVDLLRPVLSDGDGKWHADYVRLRVEAKKPGVAKIGTFSPRPIK